MGVENLLDLGLQGDNPLLQIGIGLARQELPVHHIQLAVEDRVLDPAALTERIEPGECFLIAVQLDQGVLQFLLFLERFVGPGGVGLPPGLSQLDLQGAVLDQIGIVQGLELHLTLLDRGPAAGLENSGEQDHRGDGSKRHGDLL